MKRYVSINRRQSISHWFSISGMSTTSLKLPYIDILPFNLCDMGKWFCKSGNNLTGNVYSNKVNNKITQPNYHKPKHNPPKSNKNKQTDFSQPPLSLSLKQLKTTFISVRILNILALLHFISKSFYNLVSLP